MPEKDKEIYIAECDGECGVADTLEKSLSSLEQILTGNTNLNDITFYKCVKLNVSQKLVINDDSKVA